VPLDEDLTRLDGPELVCVAPRGTTDAVLWAALARRAAEMAAREDAA
jgi:hypothetical protein